MELKGGISDTPVSVVGMNPLHGVERSMPSTSPTSSACYRNPLHGVERGVGSISNDDSDPVRNPLHGVESGTSVTVTGVVVGTRIHYMELKASTKSLPRLVAVHRNPLHGVERISRRPRPRPALYESITWS